MRDPVTADLGGIGEATLKQWAHEVGISPNPANHDVNGYDYFLTLPRPPVVADSADPLDLEPPGLACLVQVKATRNADRPIKVSLTNWERLAKSPLPAFYAVFEVSQANKVKRAFVIHVDRDWIARVLNRLRQAKPGARNTIHRRSMALSIGADDALAGLDGQNLLTKLRASVGSDTGEYFLRKRRWLETVGYDGHRFRGTFTFGISEPDVLHGMMADFAIGQLSRLPITVQQIQDIRFGIPRDIKGKMKPGDGFIELPEVPSFMELTIEASDEHGQEVVSLHCKAYAAATVFPFLPQKHRKMALKSDGVTLVLTPAESQGMARQASATFHLPGPTEVRALGGAVSAAKLIRMAHHGPVQLVLIHEGKRMQLGKLPMQWTDSELSRATLGYAAAIENTAIVMERFGIPAVTAVPFGKLRQQAGALQILAAPIKPGVTLTTSVTLDPSKDVDQGAKSVAVVNVQSVAFEDCVLFVVPVIVGEPTWEETPDHALRVSVSAPAMQTRAARILSTAQARRFNPRAFLEPVYRELEAEGVGIVVRPPGG